MIFFFKQKTAYEMRISDWSSDVCSSDLLLWQTLSLYLLLLVPIMLIAWRAARPLRDLTRAARTNPALRDATPLEEEGPSDMRDLIDALNAYRKRNATKMSDKDRMLGEVGHDMSTPLARPRVRGEEVAGIGRAPGRGEGGECG